MTHGLYHLVPVAEIIENPSNPRRAMDKAALAELTESVRAHGVLQPLLARRTPDGEWLELVAGHRRLRAAVAAGLDQVPVIERVLSDKEVLEIQIIENLQRTDLHPLEEAEGYRRLHQEFGYSVEDLAAKVGKSKAYVYSRMRYTHLPPNAKKLFLQGTLTPTTAGLIARIPDATLAERAAKEITQRRSWGDGLMTAHEARQHIERQFTLRLSEAQWSIKDAELLPAAGACTTCPKRTGNQRELFDDIKSPDVCTDPKCFGMKTDAHWLVKQAEAKQKGQEVLDAAASKKLFTEYGSLRTDAFVALDGHTRSGHPVKKVKPKDAPTVLAREPGSGRVVELVAIAHLPKSAQKAGPPAAARAEDAKRKLKRQVAALAIEKIRAARSKHRDKREWWAWLVSAIAGEFQHDGLKAYATQQGLDITKDGPREAVQRHLIAQNTVLLLQDALSDLVLAQAGNIGSYTHGYGEVLQLAVTAFHVDLRQIEKSVRASNAAKPKKKATKKARPKKPAPKKKRGAA